MKKIEELIRLLTLEKINDQTFLGQNYQAPWGRVFGGQVLAQSLHAAYQTVPVDRFAHSMHGYFILGGNLDVPITYEVDIIRDGGSFTTRRVVARQNGKAIFTMGASFQIKESGVDHQITMPNLLLPEKLSTSLEQIEQMKDNDNKAYQRLKMVLPEVFEFKSIERISSQLVKKQHPLQPSMDAYQGQVGRGSAAATAIAGLCIGLQHSDHRYLAPSRTTEQGQNLLRQYRPCDLVPSRIRYPRLAVVHHGQSECLQRPRFFEGKHF